MEVEFLMCAAFASSPAVAEREDVRTERKRAEVEEGETHVRNGDAVTGEGGEYAAASCISLVDLRLRPCGRILHLR